MLSLWPVIIVSLKVAFSSTLLVMLCSIAFVMYFDRKKIVTKIIEFIIYMPMSLPPVAAGYGLLMIFGRNAWLGRILHETFGVDIAFTFAGALVAAFTVSLGIGVRTMRIAVEKIDAQQIQVARLIGATEWQIIWHIILPQCRRAIAGGALLVFMRALSEFGATIVLAGNTLGETRTLALAIWSGMEVPGREQECLVFILVAIMISFAATAVGEIIFREKT